MNIPFEKEFLIIPAGEEVSSLYPTSEENIHSVIERTLQALSNVLHYSFRFNDNGFMNIEGVANTPLDGKLSKEINKDIFPHFVVETTHKTNKDFWKNLT